MFTYLLHIVLFSICIVSSPIFLRFRSSSSLRSVSPLTCRLRLHNCPFTALETARLSFGNYAEDKSQFASTVTLCRFLITVFKSQVNPAGPSYRDQITASLLDLGEAQGCRNRYDCMGKTHRALSTAHWTLSSRTGGL